LGHGCVIGGCAVHFDGRLIVPTLGSMHQDNRTIGRPALPFALLTPSHHDWVPTAHTSSSPAQPTHNHIHTHTRTHTHARARTHTHIHARMHAHVLNPAPPHPQTHTHSRLLTRPPPNPAARVLELGRELLERWGYLRVDELIWIKTNQLCQLSR
jgi:hypothetical protein